MRPSDPLAGKDYRETASDASHNRGSSELSRGGLFRGEQSISPRLETDVVADGDRVVTWRVHFDEVLTLAFAQHDLEPPRRAEAVHALHHSMQCSFGGVGNDRDLVRPHEQACRAVRQPLRIEIELAPGEADGAGFDRDWNGHGLADEVVHESALRPLVHLFRRSGLADAPLVEHHHPVRELQRFLRSWVTNTDVT